MLNKNWTNEDGTHDGGVSIGDKFTISWQRGPLGTDGIDRRNGAFLIEVLEAAIMYAENPSIVWVSHGVGFTIVWQPEIVKEVIGACTSQLEYFQIAGGGRFACDENERAMIILKNLGARLYTSLDISLTEAAKIIESAKDILVSRRDRRSAAGTLGTVDGN